MGHFSNRSTGIALVAIMILIALLSARRLGSLDVGFHLRAGESILEGNGWPRNDSFTYTINDHEYVDTTWGYQVLLALVHRFAGVRGLVLLHSALVLCLFALLILTARLPSSRPDGERDAALVVALLLGGLAAEIRFAVRPEVLSYTLLALVLYLLHRHSEGRRSPLWVLPLIFLIWVNAHALFVLGWGALACFLFGLALRDRALDRRLGGWALASVAVTLLNPYGWKALWFPVTLATRLHGANVFGASIGEFVSPFSLGLSEQFPFIPRVPIYAFRLFAVLALVSVVALLRRRRFATVLLLGVFAPLALTALRNIPLLVVAGLPAVVWGLPLPQSSGRRGRMRHVLPVLVVLVVVVLGLRVSSDAYYLASRREHRFGLGWNRGVLPLGVAAYIDRAALSGRMLNHLNFGGYLMWAGPHAVFIDGRLEVVGEQFYEYYRQVLRSPEALEACVARHGIESIVFPYKTNPALLGRLSRDARWQLAYVDHLAALFTRQGRHHALPATDPAAMRALRPPPGSPGAAALPGLDGQPRRQGLRRWLDGLVQRQTFPRDAFGLGLFHYYRQEWEQAATYFADAIARSSGAYYEMYTNLGSALFRMGRLAEARQCYRVVLEEAPRNRVARERLQEIERRLG